MKLNTYHCFRHDEGICLINTEKMTAVDVTEATAALLDSVSENPDRVISPSVESTLEKLGLIDQAAKDDPGRSRPPRAASRITSVALFVTQECNLNCIYCYGDGGNYGSGGHMTKDTAFKAVDWLIEQSGTSQKLGVSFFGGEPLLRFSLIKEVLYYALERGKDFDKEFRFSITTNAALLDDEKISFLAEHRIRPLISFDGPKELHDVQRPFKNGRASYDAIVPRIRELLRVLPESGGRATVVGKNDPVAIDNALRRIGFAKRSLLVASRSLFDNDITGPLPERDLSGMLIMAESEARDLRESIKERDTEQIKALKVSGVLTGCLQSFVNGTKKFFPCGAGRSSVAVSCSGDVYLCHRFVGYDAQKLGSIHGEDLKRDIYQTSLLQSQEQCGPCWAKHVCAGGCYHDNLGTTGSIFDPDEEMCMLIKRRAELAAAICSRLSEDDKAYLMQEGIIAKRICPFDLF